jgi:hypothetical protein
MSPAHPAADAGAIWIMGNGILRSIHFRHDNVVAERDGSFYAATGPR